MTDGTMDLSDVTAKVQAREPDMPVPEIAAQNGLQLNTARCTVDVTKALSKDNAVAANIAERLSANRVLHGQISRLLVSEEVHRHTHHETRGRLDRRALVRMGTGAIDVYTQRDDTPAINTAVMILIDGSGSMSVDAAGGHTRMDMAHTAAWHMAFAAEAADAKVCLAAFYTRIVGSDMRGAQISIIKPWEDTLARRGVNLASVKPQAFTPLSPAIVGAARMMGDVTQCTRRILIVLTDGDCDYGADAVRQACGVAAQLGVEVVGIGMCAPDVIHAFPPRYSVNVNDLAQLASTGMGVLVDMLEDSNQRGAD